MKQNELESRLADLSLGGIRYLDRVDSTNDEAARWIAAGAPDLALVIANEQTAGRGRFGHQWFTPPEAALAFSLVVYPTLQDANLLPRMTALGSLAVCDALRNRYGLSAQIKWPNDILLERRKAAGVLVEAQWTGSRLAAMVLGIGINVSPAAVPPDAEVRFPATCVDNARGKPVDRVELLYGILAEFIHRRMRVSAPEFLKAWENHLAYRGEWVQVFAGEQGDGNTGIEKPPLQEGQVIGLAADGSLRLITRSGEVVTAQFGEVRLRPVTS